MREICKFCKCGIPYGEKPAYKYGKRICQSCWVYQTTKQGNIVKWWKKWIKQKDQARREK